MAQRKAEIWLTSVVEDTSVDNAVVLAESLRKTKTTRNIAVIASKNVSLDKRVVLRKAFDAVFYIDEVYSLENNVKAETDDLQAKIFAFSLHFFEKCVYISPNSLVLENIDTLFEGKVGFKSLINAEDGLIDFSLFMISPNCEMWESLWSSLCHNGNKLSENYLQMWLSNQSGAVKMDKICENVLAKFSMKTGTMLNLTERTHSPLVQFVDVQKDKKFDEQLEKVQKLNTGLYEKLITTNWLNTYGDVLELLSNPKIARSLLSSGSPSNHKGNEPIAIIGMSCRYPGANTLDEFWNMLFKGEEGVREPPAFRWTKEHSLRVTPQERKTNAGFLSTTVDEFDSRFFGVSPKEAAYMDPQARLLHEVVWESLEDSGIDPLSLYGTHTGIFTGSWMNDYKDIVQGSAEAQDFFRTYMGNSIGAGAARLSFLLGLTGPSIATESGCSSAIVAVDLAVKSLRSGETNLGLAAGVNLLLHPYTSKIMDYVIAPNGRCKTFDVKADGFGRAEGCGVLVLKRLSDALRDRDNIWAMIRGSAVSQEGLSRSLGTPTVHCEALAMQLALEDAGVKPGQVSFVETHGTGTAVGDPMEVAAIAKAYWSKDRKEPLIIGSVKTNVGHTESCSGITGIMKTVLAMQHELIPRHRNMESLNPEIFLESVPARIPLENVKWVRGRDGGRIAGVSSFGITGTDGHVILEEAPEYELPKFSMKLERTKHIIKISGKTSQALDELVEQYKNLFLDKVQLNPQDNSFANVAYSGNVGRATFNHRCFITANNYQDAVKSIQENNYIRGEVKDGDIQKICFLFTGQGSQYQGMAKTLYETSPIFRTNFDACDQTLREMYNLSISHVLWNSDPFSKELSRTIYSQTSIFCVEYCLLKLWQSWGIHPDYVLGHSLGEFAAAVGAGILTFKDALKLVAERSSLIDKLPQGSMLVIKGSKPEVEKWMKLSANDFLNLEIAAINNPEQTVVAGDTKEIELFSSFLKSQGQKSIILDATHAFHSKHMDPMLQQYRQVAETINYKTGNPKVQYISGMEGRLCDSSEIDANYWVRHTREKVSFVDACTALRTANVQLYLEIGPHPVLSTFVMMNNTNPVQMTCLPSLRRGMDEWDTILNSLGKLYLQGYTIDWHGFDGTYIRNKVSLPFHPFHRKSFWVECSNNNVAMIHPLLGSSVNNASNLNIFQNDLSIISVPYLKDHCLGTRIVFPGAGYTEMCLSAGYCVANGLTESMEPPRRPLQINNLRIDAPLELKEGKGCRLQVIVDLPHQSDNQDQCEGFLVKVFHQNTNCDDSAKWVLHASTTFVPVPSTKDVLKQWEPEKVKQIMSTVQPTSADDFYKRVDDTGLKFGETFRGIRKHWDLKQDNIDSDEVVAQITLPIDHTKYLLHPLIIDAAFQTAILTGIKYTQFSKLKVPVRIGSLLVFTTFEDEAPNSSYFIHMWEKHGIYSGFIFTATFTPIAYLDNVELIDTNVRTIESVLEQQSSSISDAWEEVWRTIPSGPYTNICDLTPIAPILSEPSLQSEIALLTESKPEKLEIIRKTNRLLYLYILNALYDLGWEPKLNETTEVNQFCEEYHILPQFRQLVHFYFTSFQEEKIMHFNKPLNQWTIIAIPPSSSANKPEIENLTSQLKQTSSKIVIGIYEHVSALLAPILKGEESPLSTLFPTDPDKEQFSAEIYYQGHPSRQDSSGFGYCIVNSILKALQKINASKPKTIFRVLEVGSGTGSMSQHTLKCLQQVWGDNFEYYYTDISQSFFGKAEKKFEEFGSSMKFAVFNVEESPLSQGIPLNYFDFVVATDVLHATRDLQECLVHIRQTMRPKAALFFMETIIAARDITYLFGLLEGYWRFEDFHLRPHHACVNEQTWGDILGKTGFKCVNTSKVYEGVFGSITAEADENIEISSLTAWRGNEKRKGCWIVFCTGQDETMLKVANTIYSCGFKVLVVFPSFNKNDARKLLNGNIEVIGVTADREDSTEIDEILGRDNLTGILYGWGRDVKNLDQKKVALPFMHIAKWSFGQKKLPNLYIVTRGVHSVNESLSCNPTAGTLFGMAKSLKNENSEFFVRYVDLENEGDWRKDVNEILYELTMCKGSREAGRQQIVYRDGQRLEPKFVKAAVPTKQDMLQLPPSSERYQLVLPESRVIQDLTFDTVEARDVGENEVEVKVKGYALNFRDIFAILKPIKQFESINAVGLDFAGVVVKVGDGPLAGKWKVGDRVFGANFKDDQLPSHLVVEGDSILRIPGNMSFWEASTLPAVFATAYYCLFTVANMKKGDVVLIHTGSGGVGLAAIQLARHAGAIVITTAGNSRKRAYLRSLGIEHVFHSRNTSYEQDISRVTNGRGVDIVLNSITGPGFKEASLASCGKNGRFVEMSKLTIWSNEEVKELRPDVTYTVVDLTSLEHEKWTRLLANMTEYLDQGYLKPIPYVKFDALCIRQALQFFQKAKHVGKVVCVMPEVKMQDGQIKEFVPLFNNESTYLITGGLGGIGFEVCKWMLEKGASDIVLTARSSPKPEVAAKIRELNEKKRCNIMVRLADVSDLERCKIIIEEISNSGKPLRGVMHCAGVLRDNMYTNQTWQDFEATYKPKVGGTWNLHNLTKDMQLEHFVLYSSLTALVGTPTQPNHSSANSFEDAFAHYRHSLCLPATTINWGQWAQVGCAKEVTFIGVLPVSVRRMLNGLEMAMRNHNLQISFSEFESFANLSLICPTTRSYIDDKLWKKTNGGNENERREILNSDKFWVELDGVMDGGKLEKVKLVGNYLKIILRLALRLDGDEAINEDINIQDIGVDSLMLIELKNSIQSLLGSRIAVTAGLLKNCSTVRQIATAIVERILEDTEDEQGVVEPLSTEELNQLVLNDCQLDKSIRNHNKLEIFKPSNVKTVLLTGATGQLGGNILAVLSTKYRYVKNIICLVREIEGITGQKRVENCLKSLKLTNLVDMSKVECVRGDVTKLNLGMDGICYERLVERVDAVIHLAGKTNYSEPYRNCEDGKKTKTDIRSVNVGGTLNVLRFASDRKIKQVYFASTFMCGIFGENEQGTLPDDWLDIGVMRACVDAKLPGHQMSKFVSEILIKEASLRGIPCKVFRFPWIAGDSKTGRLEGLNNLYILRYLSFLKVSAMPSVAFAFPADLLPIDLCAEVSLALFFNDNTPFEIFNVGHPHPQVEEEFVRLAKEEFGKDLEIVEWKEFAERLGENEVEIESMKDLYKDQKSMTMFIAEAVGFVNGYLVSPETFFTNEKLNRFIPSFEGGVETSMEMVRRDLRYLKSTGFLEKFGI